MATTQADRPALGSLIRMRALKPKEMPSHPHLAAQQTADSPPLEAFISEILDEGHDFMTKYLPATFKVKDANKQSPPSKAPVELLSYEISAHDLPEEGRTMGQPETWFARTSIHENAAKPGTASWEEFDHGLRVDHSQHEKEYTPDVLDAHNVLDWSSELAGCDKKIGEWKEVEMSVMEVSVI